MGPSRLASNCTALGPCTGGDEGTTPGYPDLVGVLKRLRNAQVVLRFELTLHGWITLTEYTYYHKSVIFCSIILALLFLLHTYAGFPPVELFHHFLIQQRQSRSSL